MSLDVQLTEPQPPCPCGGKCPCHATRDNNEPEVYSANITHNLREMAMAVGIYMPCWRPEEIGITKAAQLIPILEEGIRKLRADPAAFRAYDSPNGWGLYDNFVPWLERYLAACREFPDANVRAGR